MSQMSNSESLTPVEELQLTVTCKVILSVQQEFGIYMKTSQVLPCLEVTVTKLQLKLVLTLSQKSLK